MEPGVARVAVAVNMYQTAASRNLKTVAQPENFSKRKFVSNSSSERTTCAPGSKPEIQTKRERKLVNDERSPHCLD
jgi:hypothetical protein